MTKEIQINRSTVADGPAILRLLTEARGDDLSDQERARRGFVQGQMDAAMLTRFQGGTGIFVARDKSVLAGVCMTLAVGMVKSGLPTKAVEAALANEPDCSREHMFLYGPVAVDRRYQGHGLLTRLLLHACTKLQEQFELGVVFVDNRNHKSLAIHRHYPMSEAAHFRFKGWPFTVFTFSPRKFGEHYR